MRSCLCAALLLAAGAAASAQTVTVDARSPVFDAGRAAPTPGTDGVLPPSVALPGGCQRYVTVTNVSGSVRAFPASQPGGADGNANYPTVTSDIDGYAGISGVATPLIMPLLGVFLDDSVPADPAPSDLDFIASGTDFTQVSPGLRQVFFVGDGLTSGGAQQRFNVPEGATRLFLGFADGVNFRGVATAYGDNLGSIAATINLTIASPSPPIITQQPGGGEVCPGTVTVRLTAVSIGPTTYRWRRGAQALFDGDSGHGSVYSGTETNTLRIDNAGPADSGDYRCFVENLCGGVISTAGNVTVLGCCPDFTNDGNVDQDDIACLVGLIAGQPGCSTADADFNRDGNVDQDDVAALVNVVAGSACP